jgi:hypothetical protein
MDKLKFGIAFEIRKFFSMVLSEKDK